MSHINDNGYGISFDAVLLLQNYEFPYHQLPK
jgi:hypothetical protein